MELGTATAVSAVQRTMDARAARATVAGAASEAE